CAALGAGIGALAGGGKGAAIGAGVGALVGGVTGYNWQAIKNKLAPSAAQTGTQVTEQPDGSLKLNVPSSVTFATNQYAITPAFQPLLNDLATTLNQNPQVTASIVGYTDSTGSAQLNQTLSQNRAQSVVNALAQRGVNGGRLSAQGMGASNPIADNATEAGRAQNRRVEIYLRAAQAQ
ncbi:OmpA family protein, partial [Burkholderia sp. Se-20378]|uniref:OmpA family protein n=1 Tax=Burkholderia sp. Se-20378 TaxID=2703899 RepID=UPI00197E4F08